MTIDVIRDGTIATVVLNRPARRNALSVEMLGALHDALAEVAGDADVRAGNDGGRRVAGVGRRGVRRGEA